jgi:hypothetical protein
MTCGSAVRTFRAAHVRGPHPVRQVSDERRILPIDLRTPSMGRENMQPLSRHLPPEQAMLENCASFRCVSHSPSGDAPERCRIPAYSGTTKCEDFT